MRVGSGGRVVSESEGVPQKTGQAEGTVAGLPLAYTALYRQLSSGRLASSSP